MCNDLHKKKKCKYCVNNSFASYKDVTINGKLKITCWDNKKNDKLPKDVFYSSNQKYWFTCDVCNNDFELIINNATFHNCWCPFCKYKTEGILHKWLVNNKDIKLVKKEYKPKWCSTEYKNIIQNVIKKGYYQYRYDFMITFNNNKKIIIELDGIQHFEQVKNWKTPFEQQIRDKYKEFKAKKYNIPLIRCIQEDIYKNKNNWGKKLLRKFKKYNK